MNRTYFEGFYWNENIKTWEYEDGTPVPYEVFMQTMLGDTMKTLSSLIVGKKEKREGLWNKFLNLFR